MFLELKFFLFIVRFKKLGFSAPLIYSGTDRNFANFVRGDNWVLFFKSFSRKSKIIFSRFYV